MGISNEEIREWASSASVAKKIAADLAVRISKGQLTRWNDLPARAVLADDYGVTVRTVARAMKLLADNAMVQKAGGRYYVV